MDLINKEKNFISAVIYVRDCKERLQIFLPTLLDTLKNNFEKYEIICVDDVSTDGSVNWIRQYSSQVGNAIISIVHMGVYSGIELSMNAGSDLAIGDFVYEFDNLYLSYTNKCILDLYQKSLEGYDVVSAVPQKTKGFFSKVFYNVFNKFNLDSNPLTQEAFRIISRRAINRAQSLNRNISYRKAVYMNCGLPSTKVVYANSEINNLKNDKLAEKKRRDLAFESLALFTSAIQKISGFICGIFLLFAIGCGIYTWIVYFSSQRPVEGWTALMLFLSASFFGVFLILTISLKYMAVILNLIFRKQRYLIESIEKLTNN